MQVDKHFPTFVYTSQSVIRGSISGNFGSIVYCCALSWWGVVLHPDSQKTILLVCLLKDDLKLRWNSKGKVNICVCDWDVASVLFE